MSRPIMVCVLSFLEDLEREANARPESIGLDDRVFDLLAQEVLSLDTKGIRALGLAPSVKFSIVRHVVPRCESVTLHGVRVTRQSAPTAFVVGHSGGHGGP